MYRRHAYGAALEEDDGLTAAIYIGDDQPAGLLVHVKDLKQVEQSEFFD
jgi:hypothetical protein